MRTPRLLYWLTLYYVGISAVLFAAGLVYPDVREFLPIGGVEALVAGPADGPFGSVRTGASQVGSFSASMMWLVVAIAGSLLAALPVSWTYMEIRTRQEYDQSLVQTIVILPMIVTGIVIVVHNSLALAFSLAGIAAGVRFRHSLSSAGDALFILLAIGIGLAAGIGAVELAIVMSIAFNYCFLFLWITDYGARKGTHRFLRKQPRPDQAEDAQAEPDAGEEK
ncbi:MAG TPA: DUF4956 domain-containing protein [Allosphingosinicella sp.]|nr:DUF4956 domain-containing protein [Allosphingosinicella sp.]